MTRLCCRDLCISDPYSSTDFFFFTRKIFLRKYMQDFQKKEARGTFPGASFFDCCASCHPSRPAFSLTGLIKYMISDYDMI